MRVRKQPSPRKLSKIGIEVWRNVVGYEGYYEVSNLGAVRSVTRTVEYADGRVYTYPAKIRKPYAGGAYLTVTLTKATVKSTHTVHTLVADAFLGPSNGLDVRHADHDRMNPALYNLCYGTRLENFQDSMRDGRDVVVFSRGSKNHAAKLTESDIAVIRNRAITEYHKDIAKDFGVSSACISSIVTGRTW